MKRMAIAVLVAASLLLALPVVASAAKPITRDMTATVTISPSSGLHIGDVLTVTATTDADWWKFDVFCYQDELLVLRAGWTFYGPGTQTASFNLLTPSLVTHPFESQCTAGVGQWTGFNNGWKTPTAPVGEPAAFTLEP